MDLSKSPLRKRAWVSSGERAVCGDAGQPQLELSRAGMGTSGGRITVLRSLEILGRLLAVRLGLVIRLSLHHVGQVDWQFCTNFELQLGGEGANANAAGEKVLARKVPWADTQVIAALIEPPEWSCRPKNLSPPACRILFPHEREARMTGISRHCIA